MTTRFAARQEEKLKALGQKWMGVRLCTDPAKKKEAEEGLVQAYRFAGLDPPSHVLWLPSPFRGMIAAAYISALKGINGNIPCAKQVVWKHRFSLNYRVDADPQAIAEIGRVMQPGIRPTPNLRQRNQHPWREMTIEEALIISQMVQDARVSAFLAEKGETCRFVHQMLIQRIGGFPWLDWKSEISDPIEKAAGCLYRLEDLTPVSQFDAGWLSTFVAFKELGYLKCELPGGILNIVQNAGWLWTFLDYAIFSERPEILKKDEQGRLHSETGPAVQYPDGWRVWAWHGTLVPPNVIQSPEKLTPSEILQEHNLEVRRIMIERFGPGKFMESAGGKILDQDQDIHGPRTLYCLDIPDEERLVLVRLHCLRKDGKMDTYWLRVPPDITNCQDAVAWSFGMDRKEYRPTEES